MNVFGKKYYWLWGVGLIVVLLGLWLRQSQTVSMPVGNPKTTQRELRIGSKALLVEVRNTEAERALGFSYRPSLPEAEGMLFIFPAPSILSFWMKGMEFDLDMIWIREGKVVDISVNVPAPKNNGGEIATAQPKVPADWVLEVNGGFAAANEVVIGSPVQLGEE